MAAKKHATPAESESRSVFTPEERAAMRERARERRPRVRHVKGEEELELRAAIAKMPPSDRVMAERLDAIVRAHAPTLLPKTWYGMPAYAKDDEIICFFRCAAKFKTRYATIGFGETANLDEGHMWPTDFALTELGSTEETKIVSLLKRAVG